MISTISTKCWRNLQIKIRVPNKPRSDLIGLLRTPDSTQTQLFKELKSLSRRRNGKISKDSLIGITKKRFSKLMMTPSRRLRTTAWNIKRLSIACKISTRRGQTQGPNPGARRGSPGTTQIPRLMTQEALTTASLATCRRDIQAGIDSLLQRLSRTCHHPRCLSL